MQGHDRDFFRSLVYGVCVVLEHISVRNTMEAELAYSVTVCDLSFNWVTPRCLRQRAMKGRIKCYVGRCVGHLLVKDVENV